MQKVSLKSKIIGMNVGLCIALGACSIGVMNYLVNKYETDTLDNFREYAVNLNNSISAQFYERYGDVQAFAMNPNVQSSDEKLVVETLNTYSALYGIYDLIMVIDKSGNLIAVNDKDPSGKDIKVKSLYEKNYKDEVWFKDTIAGKTTDDKEKAFSGTYVGEIEQDPYTSEVFGEKRLGSSFTAAIKNKKGDVIGVVTNRAGSRWFDVAFKEIWSGAMNSGNPGVELALFSKDGTLLYEYDPGPKATKAEDAKIEWDLIGKYNLEKSENLLAKKMKDGKPGSTYAQHSRKKMDSVAGFSPVKGNKMVDSVGWWVLARDSKDEAFHTINQAKKVFYTLFGAVLIGAIFAAFWFSNTLSNQLNRLVKRLSEGAEQVTGAASGISNSSIELSEASTEQAAAIQETAASIDEVSAMVKKSSDSADQSREASNKSRESAQTGQHAVMNVIKAIGEISESNTSIMNQVDEGNRKISEIVKVISEIESKTKVINDIVFQTKLLSFNASVEAARAGENGKGFAVVADEIGNLAQMSGSAAKEISALLESSIQKVEGIVKETQSKVQSLVVENKTKVQAGTQVAKSCGDALEKILNTVSEVDVMVSDIATASKEQSTGVGEINKAINQLDITTQKTSQIAQSSASAAAQLNSQAQDLGEVVRELTSLVDGSSKKSSSRLQPPTNKSSTHKPTHATQANVIDLADKRKKPVEQEPVFVKTANGEPVAVSSIPSADDPRFEEV